MGKKAAEAVDFAITCMPMVGEEVCAQVWYRKSGLCHHP